MKKIHSTKKEGNEIVATRDFAMLVKEKSHKLGFGEPIYRSAAYPGYDSERFNKPYEIPLQPPIGFTAKNPETGFYEFSVKIGTHFFVGSGSDLLQAKFAADKKAYQFLCHEELKDNSPSESLDAIVEESEEWGIPHIYTGMTRFWSDEEKARHEAEFRKAFPELY